MDSAVDVRIEHHALRSAVQHQVDSILSAFDRRSNARIVIATTRDLAPRECREDVALGAIVIVLAAVLHLEEQAEYLASGAIYCLMTAGERPWVDEVRRALESGARCRSGS
jgi:hypothetical protein